jgi:TP901 family phage tail tape measure protein
VAVANRSVVYRILADVSGVLAGTRQASAATKQLADDVTAVGKEGEKVRKGFDTFGRQAGRVGLVAAAGLGAMVLKAANFEQAMSNVAAATHETEQNLSLLRDAALDAGARTAFSATEAAEAITELGKAGVATADILGKNGALNGALALAAAGQLDVAQAAEIMATSLNQFQLEGESAAHVADLLAAGAGKAQGEVSDMANALKFAGVPAANLGVSIEETAGAVALLAKNGIIGEQAGTSLRGMLSALTSPSKVAKEEIEKLGIVLFNSQGQFLGLDNVAGQLSERMATLTEEERANSLGRIFGNEQLQAANVLYREGADGIQTWTANVNDSGFAADTAATKTDNLRGDIERLGGAIDTLLIQGGSGSQGFLRGLTQGVTGAVDALNKMPSSLQNTISGMLAITAITGGGLWFGSKVVRGIADTREALANMADGGTRASRAMRGVAAAGAGLGALLVAVEGIKAIQRATQESLPGLESLNKQLIELQAGQVNSLSGEFDSLAESIAKIDANTLKGIRGFGNLDLSETFSKPFGIFGIEDSGLTEAKAEIDALDESLTSLVQSGHADVAADALVRVGESAGLTDAEMSQLSALLPGYADALDGVAASASLTAEEHTTTATFVEHAGRAFRFTEEQVKAAREAYQEARQAVREVGGEFVGLGDKVDKAKVSLGQWIRDLEKQARALEQFTENSIKAAENGLDKGLIKSLQEAGPAGALRMKQLADASDAEIDRANRAFKRGQRAIEAFVEAASPKKPVELRTEPKVILDPALAKMRLLKQKFDDNPKTVITQVKVDNDQAMQGIRAVEARLARLRQFTIDLRVAHQDSRLGPTNFATGGRVSGPGSGTSDSIPAYLSNGEYVMRAAAVQRYGFAFFDRLNAMHFAQGGYVGGTASIAQADVSALLGGMSNLRPLANHVEIKTPDHKGFLREESRIRRAAASDGMPQRR